MSEGENSENSEFTSELVPATILNNGDNTTVFANASQVGNPTIKVNKSYNINTIPNTTASQYRFLQTTTPPSIIKKEGIGRGHRCPLCGYMLRYEYPGVDFIGHVARRKSLVCKLGCGDYFHIGCLIDYLEGDDKEVTIDEHGRQTEKSVKRKDKINDNNVILCPAMNCRMLSFTKELKDDIIDFIGEEQDIRTPLTKWRKFEGPEFTDFLLPADGCFGISDCTIAGSKRKTKKVKKSKRTRKKTKKRKQKLNKTKRKISKK